MAIAVVTPTHPALRIQNPPPLLHLRAFLAAAARRFNLLPCPSPPRRRRRRRAMDSPASGTQRSRPRSNRKPLQPRNSPAGPRSRGDPKTTTAAGLVPIVLLADGASDKENRLPGSVMAALAADIPPMDTSLAEELGAVRRRRERMRSEREKTEAMLLERGRLLDRAMREVERRWEEHRRVELELRRLTSLQEMAGSPCSELRPFQSLREREERRKKKAQSQVISNKEAEEVSKENVNQESSGGKGAQNVEQESDPSSKSSGLVQPSPTVPSSALSDNA